MIRILFAFPEERQKMLSLFEGGTTLHADKVAAFSTAGGFCFVSFFRKLTK
jgi:hypothetical protein